MLGNQATVQGDQKVDQKRDMWKEHAPIHALLLQWLRAPMALHTEPPNFFATSYKAKKPKLIGLHSAASVTIGNNVAVG
jgi:hypothetical protein